MNRFTIFTLTAAFVTLIVLGAAFSQSTGTQKKGQIDDRPVATNCQPPWDRSTYLGDDWSIERGMMQPGWHAGMGSDMRENYPWTVPPYRRFPKPVDQKVAQALVQNYLDSTNNPNLKLGNEKDAVTDFEFDIVTRDKSLVDRLLVNKNTGEIHSAY